jgi:hypothetical protein
MKTSQWILTVLFLCLIRAAADQVELSNGDRYTGKVLSVTASEIRLDNEINGLMKLPRNKVRAIYFNQTAAPSTSSSLLPAPRTNAPVVEDGLVKIKKGQIDPKALEQVQTDILGTAGPEANAMFNDLLKGLMTGRLTSDDLRKQAKDTMAQLQGLQKELGEDDNNPLLASYLGILQKFIDEGQAAKPAVAAPQKP